MNDNFKVDPAIVRQLAIRAQALPRTNPANLSSLWLNNATIRLYAGPRRLPVYITQQAISLGYYGLTFLESRPQTEKEQRNLYISQHDSGSFWVQPAAASPSRVGTPGSYFSWITGFREYPNRVVLNRNQRTDPPPVLGRDLLPPPGTDQDRWDTQIFLHQLNVQGVVLSPDQPWTGTLHWLFPPGAWGKDGEWGIRNDVLNQDLLFSSNGTPNLFSFTFEVVRWSPAFIAQYIAEDPLARTRCCLGQFDKPNPARGILGPDLFLTEAGCESADIRPRQPGQAPSASCNAEIAKYCRIGRNMTTPVCTETARDFPSAAIDDTIGDFCRRERITTLQALSLVQDPTVKEMCACHLPQTEYTNLELAIKKQYPSLASVSFGNTRCLVPECANSSYSTSSIRSGCKGVMCISAINFAPGTADIGKVDINSTVACSTTGGNKCTIDKDCPDVNLLQCKSGICVARADVKPPTPPGPPTPPRPPGPDGSSDGGGMPWWGWVLLIVGVIALISLIIYAIRPSPEPRAALEVKNAENSPSRESSPI